MFVSEKWKPPSIIWIETGAYGPREAALLKDQGNFCKFGLIFVCMCIFCMCVLNLKPEVYLFFLIDFIF